MSEAIHPGTGRLKKVLVALVSVATILAVVLLAIVLMLKRSSRSSTPRMDVATSRAGPPSAEFAPTDDFASSNSVSVVFGDPETLRGLRRVDWGSDGVTLLESVEGAPARVLRIAEGHAITYLYVQTHPSFKQVDLSGARFDVEYFATEPGTIGIHYDAMDSAEVTNPRYRDARGSLPVFASNAWQIATFHTRGDGLFANRQNGRADFRIFSKATVLAVRRVTVTREATKADLWSGDYSTSNQVTLAFTEQVSGGGLRHNAEEGDGRTQSETIEGVACRHLNRTNKTFGYLYFTLSPSFKRDELQNVRVDAEYLVSKRVFARLQFDGMRGDVRSKYVTTLAEQTPPVNFGGGAQFGRLPVMGTWDTMTFHLTNAVFKNGQNGDSDFRIEVNPADIYVRRITVTREPAPAGRP